MHPPKIFISATSGDLRSIRQIVKEALLTIMTAGQAFFMCA